MFWSHKPNFGFLHYPKSSAEGNVPGCSKTLDTSIGTGGFQLYGDTGDFWVDSQEFLQHQHDQEHQHDQVDGAAAPST